MLLSVSSSSPWNNSEKWNSFFVPTSLHCKLVLAIVSHFSPSTNTYNSSIRNLYITPFFYIRRESATIAIKDYQSNHPTFQQSKPLSSCPHLRRRNLTLPSDCEDILGDVGKSNLSKNLPTNPAGTPEWHDLVDHNADAWITSRVTGRKWI